MWRGLGYWIAQQDVARGNQPWYYYFVITPLYEFLPLALAIAAALYYWVKRRADAFHAISAVLVRHDAASVHNREREDGLGFLSI